MTSLNQTVVAPSSRKHRAPAPLVLELRDELRRGGNVVSLLDRHPEVADQKLIVLDLMSEEFSYRQAAGQEPDPEALAGQMPRFRSSICKVLVSQQFLAEFQHLIPPDEPTPWPKPGETVNGFFLERELGQGAFSRVYLAREEELGNRPVALKITHWSGNEADILGQLRHDNIVPVHSLTYAGCSGWALVCMPYFGQATLEDVLDYVFAGGKTPETGKAILEAVQPPAGEEAVLPRSSPRPLLQSGTYVEAVVDIGIQLAEALAFVHSQRIFHRDLKPSNVLMGPDGKPRLLDFNLSFDQKGPELFLGGSLPYMAPEQLRATDPEYTGPPVLLDARSDLYSLGVILYEMLAGVHPLAGLSWKGPDKKLRRRLLDRLPHGPQPLGAINTQVNKDLAGIIHRCLAYRQEDRFASAEELTRALRGYLTPAQRAGRWLRRHCRPLLVGTATLLLGLVLPLAAYYLQRAPYEERQVQQALEAYQAGRFAEARAYLDPVVPGGSSRVHFLRGMTALHLKDWEAALADFRQAEQDGRTKACLAFCYSQKEPPRLDLAVHLYKEAIARGYDGAVVYNNLGYCCFRSPGQNSKACFAAGRLNEGIQALEKALALDPKLQSAYHTLALIDLQIAWGQPKYVPRRGMKCITKALENGTPNGHLYLDAACLYALAGQRAPDQPWAKQALTYVLKAIEFGVPPSRLQNEINLRNLRTHPRYLRALALPAQTPLGPPLQHFLNPVPQLF